MRALIVALVMWIGMVSCVTAPRDIHPVWTQKMPPAAGAPTPPGFLITPAQAYATVHDARALSLKHIWHIYSDARYYYVHDAFFGDGPRRAYLQGVRIDGRTGELVKR